MKSIYLTFIISIYAQLGICQSHGISINTTGNSPHVSSILDVESTSKGLLIPRMTLSNRLSIATPANGLIVYQTDSVKGFWYNEGTETSPLWKHLGSGGGNLPPGQQNQTLRYNAGNWEADSFLTNTGNKIGIGTTNPSAGLEIISYHGIRANGLLNNGNIQNMGAGVHMLWYPRKAAFRAGATDDGTMNGAPGFYPDGNTRWNDSNIGQYSFSGGYANKASGVSSASLGEGNITSAKGSIGLGLLNSSSGFGSAAIGVSSVSKNYGSISLGVDLVTKCLGCTTVGISNDTSDTFVENFSLTSDRVFQIGIGFPNTYRRNAMTVLKNGNVGIGQNMPLHLLELRNYEIGKSAFHLENLNVSNLNDAFAIKNYGGGNALYIRQYHNPNAPVAAYMINNGAGATLFAEKNLTGNCATFLNSSIYSDGFPTVYIKNTAPHPGLRIDNNSSAFRPHLHLFETDSDFVRIKLNNNIDSLRFWQILAFNHNLASNERMIFYNSSAGNVITMTGDGYVGVNELNPSTRFVSRGDSVTAIVGLTYGSGHSGVEGYYTYAGIGTPGGFGVKGVSNSERGVTKYYGGVQGKNTGNGNDNYGIIGVIDGNATGGAAVGGFANSSTSGVYGWTEGVGSALKGEYGGTSVGTALELKNGAIKVSGINKPVFIHTTNAGNNTLNYTTLDHPFLNNNPNAMLIITHQFNGNYLVGGIGVWYNNITNRWTIYLENNLLAMPDNEKFFVMVVL